MTTQDIKGTREKIRRNMPSNSAAPSKASAGFRRYDQEAWFIARLGSDGARIEDGPTDYASRRERIRKVIIDTNRAQSIIGKKDGEPETFSQFFERFYDQPLEAT